jgi:uncharacterized membrane protein
MLTQVTELSTVKKWISIMFLTSVLTLVFFIGSVSAAEQIISFDTNYKINKDRTVDVTEKIIYDFSDFTRHGIYRTITNNGPVRLLTSKIKIDNVRVVDEYGRPYPFVKKDSLNKIEIKIGDPNRIVSGVKTYQINYRLERSLSFLPSHDEFYWNVTGNDWFVPILNVKSRVELFSPLEQDQAKIVCFSGKINSNASCGSAGLEINNRGEVVAYKYEQAILRPGEGLTIAAGWPKGLISKPSIIEKLSYYFKDNYFLLAPFIIFAILYFVWWKFGRDANRSKVIIPEYEIPNGLTPIEVGTLRDDRTDVKDVSAEIIYLATKGYIKITKKPSGSILFAPSYVLERLKKPESSLATFDQDLMNALFPGEENTFKINDYSSDPFKMRGFQVQLKKSLKKVSQSFKDKGFYTHNIRVLQSVFGVVSIFLIIIAIRFSVYFGFVNTISIIFCGIIVALFGKIMPQKTVFGNELHTKIRGLKLYMDVAEKDRINFHNAPEKNPEVFEKLLPYAIVLGVEKKWAEQFKDIYRENPSWYSAPVGNGVFNSMVLVSSLKTFDSHSRGLFAGSSGGAFGGGGGVGGGGGGGGGGSW